jgi:hypothetical protein
MSAIYSSFLLRCWARDGQLRIDAEHVQSGQQTLELTLAAVVNWIEHVMGEIENAVAENQGRQKILSVGDSPLEVNDTASGRALLLSSKVDG